MAFTHRDVDRDTVDHYFDKSYNGLLNVGKETKMYFKASVDEGDLTGPVWTIFEKPSGSVAAFGATKNLDASTQLISFIPDMVGIYKISVTSGTMSDTLAFNSALYLGVNSTAPNCMTCHNIPQWGNIGDQWKTTNHSHTLKDGLDGTLSSHFGNSCVECHSTGYYAGADNNGFDDFDFIFPGSLYDGVYDSLTTLYPDAMARANVQCESCHGPGSGHNGLIQGIAKTVSADNCMWCHDSGVHEIFGYQWKHSGEDASEFDERGFEGDMLKALM